MALCSAGLGSLRAIEEIARQAVIAPFLADALRRAVTADLTARGGTLARLQTHVPAVTMPALVIAQRLYGDPARMEARAAEIVARNKVPHPGFVPGGAALQVLSAEAANG